MRSLLGCWLLLLAAQFAQAHFTPTSAIFLDIGPDNIGLQANLALDDLLLAAPELPLRKVESGYHYSTQADSDFAKIARYLNQHIQIKAPDGSFFNPQVLSLQIKEIDSLFWLQSRILYNVPQGYNTTRFTLYDNAIVHSVVSHRTYISLRSSFRDAVFPNNPRQLGTLRLGKEAVTVDLADGSVWRGMLAMLQHGISHIAEGTDHWLFLLCLLLPAPLVALSASRSNRNGTSCDSRAVIIVVLKTVTAFTLGHSMTLALAVFGLVELPSRPVEILVAVSIAIAAMPLLWLRHTRSGNAAAIFAGIFGLVHGLAFASGLANLGFSNQNLLLALIAFNIGIELMQLAIVAAVLPWLIAISRLPLYKGLVRLAAIYAITVAIGWALERALERENPLLRLAAPLESHPLQCYSLLAVGGIIALWITHRKRTQGRVPLHG